MLVRDMLLYPEWVEEDDSLAGNRKARKARRKKRRVARKARRKKRKAAKKARRARRKGRSPAAQCPVAKQEREDEAQKAADSGTMTEETPDVHVATPVEPSSVKSILWPEDKPFLNRPAVWIAGGIIALIGLVAVTVKEK